jgi:hypothetical protein
MFWKRTGVDSFAFLSMQGASSEEFSRQARKHVVVKASVVRRERQCDHFPSEPRVTGGVRPATQRGGRVW